MPASADQQYISLLQYASGTWVAQLLDNTLVTASFYAAPGTYKVNQLPESDASGVGRITLTLARAWDVTNEVGRVYHNTTTITWTPGTTTAGTNPLRYVHIFKDTGNDATSLWDLFIDIGEWSSWGTILPVNLSTDGTIHRSNDGHI